MTYSDISTLIDVNLPNGNQIKSVKHREVEHALLDYIQANLSQSGDIKRIKCDLTYYTANFETDGLGKNLRLGWAQCNGNNGTDDLTGRVGIGFGLGYSTFGAIGGSKNAVLVAHTHGNKYQNKNASGSGSERVLDNSGGSTLVQNTESAGVDGTDKNMQPYIVQLYIMKL